MKYLIPITYMILSMSAMAADNPKNNAQVKPWTEEYQYGSEQPPKTGKASEHGEFEIAPKQ